jgi:hypothetical protein
MKKKQRHTRAPWRWASEQGGYYAQIHIISTPFALETGEVLLMTRCEL